MRKGREESKIEIRSCRTALTEDAESSKIERRTLPALLIA
jgi:hypothetical protein